MNIRWETFVVNNIKLKLKNKIIVRECSNQATKQTNDIDAVKMSMVVLCHAGLLFQSSI